MQSFWHPKLTPCSFDELIQLRELTGCLTLLQDFLEAYKGVDFTKSPEKYFKFSVKDIQAMLLDSLAR